MNILLIDTSDNKKVKVGLRIGGTEDVVEQELGKQRAQVVLPLIDQLLKKHNLTPQDLTGITVTTGPGSFTGLRVGITIANTLGYTLKIPVNGKKVGEMAEAKYSE
jgi:tRNA threonylcarbamoyladenosine biosynthesis protein TsaB